MDAEQETKIYFSEVFNVDHSVVEEYGALDISLVCDNPAFVDPFLIFANPKYSELHVLIIKYLEYLRDLSIKSNGKELDSGTFKQYYKFPEVKQAWLGYSVDGNGGLGLGIDFATSLHRNLNKIFANFGKEKITEAAHMEKLCLIEEGVGVDKISDFTLNLIKKFLLEYTQEFASQYIDAEFVMNFAINKVTFDFKTGIWSGARYALPFIEIHGKKEFVLLVPKEMLTKHETWISRNNFLESDSEVFHSITNDELRAKFNKFFHDNLLVKYSKRKKPQTDFSKKSRKTAMAKAVLEYPEVLDYYIKAKEQEKEAALGQHVAKPEEINFFFDTSTIQSKLKDFPFKEMTSVDDCVARISFFKQTLESNSKSLNITEGVRLQEKQLQLLFKMTTYGSMFDYNSEVNNGRGPIDFIVSYGSQDKVGLELKLASNSKLKQNLQNQGDVYKSDSNLRLVIKVIFYFNDKERERIGKVLTELKLEEDDREIFLIDCRPKASASNVV